MPTPSPAAMRLNRSVAPKKRCTISGERKLMAKKPRTTEGIPAKISKVGFRIFRTVGLAYSER